MNHRKVARLFLFTTLGGLLVALVVASLSQQSQQTLQPEDAYQDKEVVARKYDALITSLAEEGLKRHRSFSHQLELVRQQKPEAHPRARNNVGVVARMYKRMMTDAQMLQLPRPLLADSAQWNARTRKLVQGLKAHRQALEHARKYLEDPAPAKLEAYQADTARAGKLLRSLTQPAASEK